MSVFVHIVYIVVAFMMVLGILIQSGKGGGLGAGLGGSAATNVFGGGGGADFMTKLTQSFAALFMLCALYLAYEGTHTGSSLLEKKGKENAKDQEQITESGEINFERIGDGRIRELPPALAQVQPKVVEPEPTPEPEPEPEPAAEQEGTGGAPSEAGTGEGGEETAAPAGAEASAKPADPEPDKADAAKAEPLGKDAETKSGEDK